MSLLEVRNIRKAYKNDDQQIEVLKGISISFPDKGMIGIVGKSGCGKSTLLNIIASYEKPDSGEVIFNGKAINKLSNKKVNEYRNKCIGYLFQHYNLLEDLNCTENIALPMMILGDSSKRSFSDAEELLKMIDLPPEIHSQIVKDMSGGEKQRIGLLRALINDPNIILCDEPTGALDSNNSSTVMELLKKCSKSKLIIVVSHNTKLLETYADRVIKLNDGLMIEDKSKSIKECEEVIVQKVKKGKKKDWQKTLLKSNIEKTKSKTILSLISLSIGFISTLVSIGFISGSQSSLNQQTKCHLDYGVSTISKTLKTNESSGPSIVKTYRPTNEEMFQLEKELEEFNVGNNYDFLLPPTSKLKFNDEEIQNFQICPVYDFSESAIDHNLLIEGRFPNNTLNECVINKQGKEYLINKFGNWKIEISCLNNSFYIHDYENEHYEDTFSFDEKMKIVGVVDELEFLSNNKIYYSFANLDQYLDNRYSDNSSIVYGDKISWKTIVQLSDKNENISSFSYRLFAKNIKTFKADKSLNNPSFELTSINYDISDALLQLIDSTREGIIIFLIVIIIGTTLICGIVNYSNFSDERHNIAILFSLGCSFSDVIDLFTSKSLLIGSLSLAISTAFSLLIEIISNVIIESATGFKSVIKIPWFTMLGYNWLFPIVVITSMIVISILTSAVPVLFSKRVSIKEELMDE